MNWDRVLTILLVAVVIGSFSMSATLAAVREAPAPERDVLVGVQGPGNGGEVARVNANGSLDWHRTKAASVHDITQLNRTHLLATYASGSKRCGPYPAPCGRTGIRILRRGSGEVVYQWSMPVRSVGNSEIHDAEPLPGNRYLIADMDRERIMILNATTAEISWEWRASRRYDAPADPTRTDWLHINDVDRLAPGRYLISVRNANQLLIIERGQGVVEVINADRDPRVLRGQHNPQWLGPGRVLVADSSNDRIVELAKRNGTWEPVWSVTGAAGQPFAWPRDADRLPSGNTLITDSRNHRVVLVAPNGSTVAAWRTPQLPYEAELAGGRERVGAPTLNGSVTAGTGEGGVWAFRQAVIGLQHGLGAPAWLQWWHFAVAAAAISIRGVVDAAILWRQR